MKGSTREDMSLNGIVALVTASVVWFVTPPHVRASPVFRLSFWVPFLFILTIVLVLPKNRGVALLSAFGIVGSLALLEPGNLEGYTATVIAGIMAIVFLGVWTYNIARYGLSMIAKDR